MNKPESNSPESNSPESNKRTIDEDNAPTTTPEPTGGHPAKQATILLVVVTLLIIALAVQSTYF